MGCGGHDAERHEGARVGLGDLEGRLEAGEEGVDGLDDLVGGQHCNDGVGVSAMQDGCRPGSCVERVASGRLAEQIGVRHLGQLAGDLVDVGLTSADENALGREHLGRALVGEAQQ